MYDDRDFIVLGKENEEPWVYTCEKREYRRGDRWNGDRSSLILSVFPVSDKLSTLMSVGDDVANPILDALTEAYCIGRGDGWSWKKVKNGKVVSQ